MPFDADAPLHELAPRFTVYHSRRIALAAGDLVRITRGGMTADRKHRLNNGAVYRIKGFSKRGDIELANGWVIAKEFGHLAYGYVATSHASQGKTVDRVFIGQSAFSMRAASKAQFYVSVSRAREQATIYTDDRVGLLEAVSRDDDRLTATELASSLTRLDRSQNIRRQEQLRAQHERDLREEGHAHVR
jgi:ATP-dependent exoDNAse (exonuclease V) alpha subunit